VEEWGLVTSDSQKPLELIHARNLLTSLSTPAFLVDRDARLIFYNEAAGALLGRSFEDSGGRMDPSEWTAAFKLAARGGAPLALDEHPLTTTLREGRPAHAEFTIRPLGGEEQAIEASGFPLVGNGAAESGAMILFWPRHNGDSA
jgi:PAS domain-containing protein